MKIKYIAYDETEFETREECMKYEKDIDKMESQIILLDENFNKCVNRFEIDDVKYIFSPTKETHNYIYDNYFFDLPRDRYGWSIYNDYDDTFYPFLDEFVDVKEKYHTLLKAKKELKKYN